MSWFIFEQKIVITENIIKIKKAEATKIWGSWELAYWKHGASMKKDDKY